LTTFRVDGPTAAGYTAAIRAFSRVCRVLAPLFGVAVVACASGIQPVHGPVSPDLEREAVQATAPDRPLRIIFDWTVRERDARFQGQGAARVQDPYRARLDLFGPRGETYLSAAVVDGEIRLPASVSPSVVPPAPLLWSALGVLRPPVGTTLVGTARDGDRVRLEYRDAGGQWRFELVAGRLRRAEWIRSDGARQTVELKGEGAFRLPREAVYRDWAAYTELTLTLDEVEPVDAFPPETWSPQAG